jgi:hypothetical protein
MVQFFMLTQRSFQLGNRRLPNCPPTQKGNHRLPKYPGPTTCC